MLNAKDLISSYRVWKIITKAQLPAEKAAEACMEQQPKYKSKWNRVRRAVANGEPLSSAIKPTGLWPAEAIHAVKAGEASRRLHTVFDSLIEMTEKADEIATLTRRRLQAPIAYALIGQAMFFGFYLKLYPSLTARAENRSGIIEMMDIGQSIVQIVFIPWLALVIGAAVLLVTLRYLPEPRDRFLALVDMIPAWGSAQQLISCAYWSQTFAMLDTTGSIHDEESIEIATSVLKPRYQAGFKRLLSEYRQKGTLAAAANPAYWPHKDARRKWPTIFKSAVFSGSMADGVGDVLGDVWDGLLEEGQAQLTDALDKVNIIAMLIAGLSVGGVMLLMAMSSIAQTMAVL